SSGEGFKAALVDAGAPSRAIVMRNGADSEMTSGIGGPESNIVMEAPGILRANNRAVASPELYVMVDVNKRSTGTAANVPLRGVEPIVMQVRDEVRVVEGRMFQFGTNEAIVGRSANRQFKGVDLGSEYVAGNLKIKIVGIFD